MLDARALAAAAAELSVAALKLARVASGSAIGGDASRDTPRRGDE